MDGLGGIVLGEGLALAPMPPAALLRQEGRRSVTGRRELAVRHLFFSLSPMGGGFYTLGTLQWRGEDEVEDKEERDKVRDETKRSFRGVLAA